MVISSIHIFKVVISSIVQSKFVIFLRKLFDYFKLFASATETILVYASRRCFFSFVISNSDGATAKTPNFNSRAFNGR